MADGPSTPCPGDDHLAAYVTGELPESEQLALERHGATCEVCATAVAQALQMAGRLADLALVTRLHRRQHATVIARALAALEVESTGDSALQSTLAAWAAQWRDVSDAVASRLAAFARASQFSVCEGADLVREFGWIFPIDVEAAVAARDARATPAIRLPSGVAIVEQLYTPGGFYLVLEGLPDPGRARLVAVLIPHRADERSAYSILESKDGSRWIARFRGVRPGQCTLAIQAVANPGSS